MTLRKFQNIFGFFRCSKNIILAWASGSGLSGLAAALSYAALSDIGFTPSFTLILMLVIPLLQLIAFLMIKEPNHVDLSISNSESTTSLIDDRPNESSRAAETRLLNMSEKLRYSPKLLKYFLPLMVNFFCEYIINQGLVSGSTLFIKNVSCKVQASISNFPLSFFFQFDLLYIPNISWLGAADQYRWLQVICQIGVFMGRTSLTFISIKQLWLLNLLILVNAIYCTFQAIYMIVPIIWLIFIFVFFEGFTSGCTYVNAYHRIANEIPAQYKTFAVCLASIGPTTGIIIAGFTAIPIHNVICKLPSPLSLTE